MATEGKKTQSRVKKTRAKLGMIRRNWKHIEKFEMIAGERDRYFTERQILFDQSNNWRVFLANKYLDGKGVEIGPAEHPLAVPHWAKVTYVDEISTDDLIKLYPYLKKHDLVNIDVVDDGQSLTKFKDKSQNFIVANHFLEHVIDPIKTLRNFYRVLKPNGIIYMAVPDKRFTFDKLRPATTLDKLVDYHADPSKAEAGKWDMFLESAHLLEAKQGKEIEKRAKELFDQKFSIHLNVWAQHDLVELLLYIIKKYKFLLDFEAVVKNEHEIILILRKMDEKILRKSEPKSVKNVRKVLKLPD